MVLVEGRHAFRGGPLRHFLDHQPIDFLSLVKLIVERQRRQFSLPNALANWSAGLMEIVIQPSFVL
jgi:hypothetical protein